MVLQPNPLMTGFDQGVNGTNPWNSLTPDDARGPLTLDPQGVALGQQFQAIKDQIAAEQAEAEARGQWTGGQVWEGGHPTGAGMLDAIGQVGTAVALGTGSGGDAPAPGFTAYHGSPHSFDQFDLSKIGTGEGAQAYGHGMYLADSEGVARNYRDALSQTNPTVNHYLRLAQGDRSIALNNFDRDVEANAFGFNIHPEELAHIRGQLETPPGHMYEVNVNADPDHFLDLDKPRDQLASNVQAFAKQNYPQAWEDAADGSSLYAGMVREHEIKSVYDLADRMGITPDASAGTGTLQRLYSVKGQLIDRGVDLAPLADPHVALSQHMQAGGIPGIRYLDQGSRSAGEGTKNSVVFDPATMDIIRRYGLASLMAGGGAAALSGQPGQQQ